MSDKFGGSGGRVEVFVSSKLLSHGWKLKGEAAEPDLTDIKPGTEKSVAWKAFLGDLARDRKVWGTEVYTDDSDMLAMLVHSGFLLPPMLSVSNQAKATRDRSTAGSGEGILVTLRVVGRLVRYISTERNGLKSRGWGNGHDGGSLVVETVRRVPVVSLTLSLGVSAFISRRHDTDTLFVMDDLALGAVLRDCRRRHRTSRPCPVGLREHDCSWRP